MSKISAQIWAFVVMVVALVLGVLFVNNQDINTEVKTAEDTLLPNVFPAEGQENPTGLTFRYPRQWTVLTQDTSFNLSTQIDEETAFSAGFTLSQSPSAVNLEEELLAFLQAQGVTVDPQDFEDNAEEVDHGLEAVRYELDNDLEDTTTLYELVRLTDDNILLYFGSAAVDKADFGEVEQQVSDILNSINAENVIIPQALLTYTLPEGWQVVDESDTSYRALILVDEASSQGALVWLQLLPKADAIAFVSGVMGDVTPEAQTADVTSASELLSILAEQENLISASEVTPVELFGLTGEKVDVEVETIGLLEFAVLPVDDTTDAVLVVNYTAPEVKELQQANVESILASTQYNALDAE